MKKTALKKEFHREIRRSFQRFLSIFLIAALGVAFFAGLRSCKSDMLLSADAFYDETHMMDLQLLSSMGVTKEDLEAVQQVPGVLAAEGIFTKDVLVKFSDRDLVVRLYPLTTQVNTYHIIEGRLPEKMDECAADERFLQSSGYQVGDTVTIHAGDGEDLGETIPVQEVTITGVVSTGRYLSMSRGSGTIGNGRISSFLVLYPENLVSDYYTEIAITLEGAEELNSYGDAYDTLVEQRRDAILTLEQAQTALRLSQVQERGSEEIASAREEVAKNEEELLSGEEEIAAAELEIADGFDAIEAGREELLAQREAAPAAYEEAEQEIAAANEALQEAYEELAQREEPVVAAREEYDAYVEQLKAISQGPDDIKKILALKGIYEEDILAAEEEIAAAREELAGQELVIAAMQETLKEEQEKAEAAFQTAEEELDARESELLTAQTELAEQKQEYYDTLEENKEKIALAYEELLQQEEELRTMEAPEWYLLDRNALESYVSFEQDADRMAAIGEVFPVIFFLVAALVSLTTMTRMVDEERTQIGTLKALGYHRFSIAGKYIKYALYATLSGSVVGFLAGGKIFPYVVITTYKLVYGSLPKVLMPINWYYALLATVLAVLCTTLAALASCLHELREQPASLMRPAAPKSGKRIFLERIGFLWKHLSFTKKASLRNLFRYKKRLLMTVIGIGGCMALLLVGFGLKDSICVMSELQFGELWLEDATITYDTNAEPEQIQGLVAQIEEDERILDYTFLREVYVDAASDKASKSITMIVLPQTQDFDDFFVFRDRNKKTTWQMSEEGVFISEKLANQLGIEAGDTIQLKPDASTVYEVRVAQVVENYIYHYVYMTAAQYEALYQEVPVYNECYLKLSGDNDTEERVATDLLERQECITSLSVTSTMRGQIDDMLQSLNVITYVLIICAGLLAFIVLYNLNNINITERQRELATLKVLGFYDGEVSAYVYRETVLLTFFGMVLGVLLGKVLHGFVITTCEVDMVMFGRVIEPISYLYSILLTLFFSLFVGVLMHWKLKKINMIESLKSIE